MYRSHHIDGPEPLWKEILFSWQGWLLIMLLALVGLIFASALNQQKLYEKYGVERVYCGVVIETPPSPEKLSEGYYLYLNVVNYDTEEDENIFVTVPPSLRNTEPGVFVFFKTVVLVGPDFEEPRYYSPTSGTLQIVASCP